MNKPIDNFSTDLFTRGLIAEFFEEFLNHSGYAWTYERDRKYISMIQNIDNTFGQYAECLDYEIIRLRLEYSLLKDPIETDLGIPYFGTAFISDFIQDNLTFGTIGALFFLLANITWAYRAHSHRTDFINRVVSKLADYFIEHYMDQVRELGGWMEFCIYFYKSAKEDSDVTIHYIRFVRDFFSIF